jgi:formate hydrogenlyase subunit 3/multisubunit Na+/H+ antiporter MnhD subunit
MQKKEYNIAPLSGGFMITSIVGFIISAIFVYPRTKPWGFTFVVFFILMFVASMISMTYSPVDPKY